MIKKHTGCGMTMAKVLLAEMDEKLVAKAIAQHGKRDVCIAMDNSVENLQRAVAMGLDTFCLVGADADPKMFSEYITSAPVKKAAPKAKKQEAKKDEPTTE